MRVLVTTAALAALILVGCSSPFVEEDLPELSVALAGEPGQTIFSFSAQTPGSKATAAVSLSNLGKADLEIRGLATDAFTKTDAGDSTGTLFRLKNEVADEASIVVYVDDSKCAADGNWSYDAGLRAVRFEEAGDCWPPEGTPLAVEYLAVQNPYVKLDLLGKAAPTDEAPFVIESKEVNPFKTFDFEVVYQPGDTPEGGDFAVAVRSNDDQNPEVLLTFRVSAPAPRLVVYPPSKVFLNPAYECQEFTLSNTGNADLVYEGVTLENSSNLYQLKDWPNEGEVVPPNGDPLSFKVCYTPQGATLEANSVWIATNDPLNGQAKVSISNSPQGGAYEITHADMGLGYVDFTGQEHGTLTKDISFYTFTKAECAAKGTSCGGPVKIVDLALTPTEAPQAYSWVLRKVIAEGQYEDITSSETKDDLILNQKFLYAVQAGKAVQLSVTYNADAFLSGLNATLRFDLSTPLAETASLELFGGTPKGEFDLAPANTQLHYNVTAAEAKSLSAYVYNTGNGPLTISKLEVTGKWTGESEDFALDNPTQAAGAELAPFGVLEIPITFQYKSGDDKPSGRLNIYYVDAQVGEVSMIVELNGNVDLGIAYPVALPEAQGTPTAGAPLTLSAANSTPTPGASIGQYIWYLVEKPAASKARLNEISNGPTVSFTPDLAGNYTLACQVFNVYSTTAVFSDPGFAAITVP